MTWLNIPQSMVMTVLIVRLSTGKRGFAAEEIAFKMQLKLNMAG
jgi:hypothetical protein